MRRNGCPPYEKTEKSRWSLCCALLVTAAVVAGCGSGGPEPAGGARLRFAVAPVERIDYMKFNQLCNFLDNYRPGETVDPEIQAALDATKFGTSLTFFTGGGRALSAAYEFEPAARGTSVNGDLTTWTFDEAGMHYAEGVPYVRVTANIEVAPTSLERGDGTKLRAAERPAYLDPTEFFPVHDPAVKAAAAEATRGASTPGEKVEAVQRWVREHIEYAGPSGTRYGVLKVLEQRFGRCWDAADVCVTLARAAGVPTREVAGWLTDQGQGHVWAQSFIEGKGWIGVDATSNRVGNGSQYVPFFMTADGNMPFLYVEFPSLESL